MHYQIRGPARPSENTQIYPDVDLYFQKVVEPGLTARHDDDAKGIFLNCELEKWERTEVLLAEWAKRDDGSPNPFTPSLDPEYVSSIIAELNGYLGRLHECEASAPELAAAE
jgi:hypothetical protein